MGQGYGFLRLNRVAQYRTLKAFTHTPLLRKDVTLLTDGSMVTSRARTGSVHRVAHSTVLTEAFLGAAIPIGAARTRCSRQAQTHQGSLTDPVERSWNSLCEHAGSPFPPLSTFTELSLHRHSIPQQLTQANGLLSNLQSQLKHGRCPVTEWSDPVSAGKQGTPEEGRDQFAGGSS